MDAVKYMSVLKMFKMKFTDNSDVTVLHTTCICIMSFLYKALSQGIEYLWML